MVGALALPLVVVAMVVGARGAGSVGAFIAGCIVVVGLFAAHDAMRHAAGPPAPANLLPTDGDHDAQEPPIPVGAIMVGSAVLTTGALLFLIVSICGSMRF